MDDSFTDMGGMHARRQQWKQPKEQKIFEIRSGH
jgi:hypothetical protein